MARYRELKANEPRNWDFGEGELNDLGYRLLQARKVEEAIAIFRVNAEEHPKSFNVYDSLADGYESHGDHDLAIVNYQKSLELNPQNTHAAEAITRLQQSRAPPVSR